MKYSTPLVFSFFFVITCPDLSAQEPLNQKNIFPDGISIKYGVGSYSVRDEFLSVEKYSGAMPFFSVDWTRFRDNSGFRILFSTHNSSEIKNKNMTADVVNFSLAWDYFSQINTFQLFSQDCYLFAGPSAEMYIYSNDQNYATDGIFFDMSFVSLISIGLNTGLYLPITNKFSIESSIRTNIFSLGIRMPLVNEVDGAENDKSRFKLLTLFKAINSSFDLGVRYYLFNNLSMKAAYRFQYTNISVWEKLVSASDHLLLSFTYEL